MRLAWISMVIIGLIIVGGGVWLKWNRDFEPQEVEEAVVSVVDEGSEVVLGPEGGPTSDELSLMEWAAQSFEGDNFTVGRVLAENEAYTRYYITYESNGLVISGIMNVPRGEGPFPLLVLNHGFIDPAVYTNGRGLRREQDYLARRGYVVVHSDYRNHADSDRDPDTDRQFRFGYVEDVINAILAIREARLPYVDGERVGMLGHSMGGGVAWRVAVAQPELVDAFVQLAPVSADERDNFDRWMRRRPETAQAIISMYGEPEQNPDFWDNVSPITFFERVRVPVMIHHGTSDESVPLSWSERSAKRLEELTKNVTLYTYAGEPHEFAAAWPTVMSRTLDFFDQYVKEE